MSEYADSVAEVSWDNELLERRPENLHGSRRQDGGQKATSYATQGKTAVLGRLTD